MMTLARPLRGIVPPLLTPLAGRDTLDSEAFYRLIEKLVAAGSSALFILGSTGEAPGLSARLKRSVIDCAADAAGGRVPVLAGISDTAYVESLALAEYAARAGVTAVVLAAPYYYSLSQAVLLGYLERITAELPLPLYLYNMPRYTGISIEPETLRVVLQIPSIYGLKDSSGDREYFRRVGDVIRARPDFTLLAGVEEILADMLLTAGAHGGVCGGANLDPGLFVELYEAATRGDHANVRGLQERVLDLSASIYRTGDPASSYLRGLKCAVSLAGFGNGIMAEPYQAMDTGERAGIRSAMVRLGLLPGQ